jgi:MerR family copper efflux transcriptional regulator
VSDENQLLQIGEVAERVGLSLRTIRYYEEVGLVSPSERTQGGFRLYSESAVERLGVLKGMKPLGLTLEEIRELMALLEKSAEPERLEPAEVEELAGGLAEFLELADERVATLVRHLAEARRLRGRIEERSQRCETAARRLPSEPAL